MKRKELKKLRKKSVKDLKKIVKNKKLDLMKWVGETKGHKTGYDSKWHPPIRETKRDIARILTIIREKKSHL